jgi:hypothetical protein
MTSRKGGDKVRSISKYAPTITFKSFDFWVTCNIRNFVEIGNLDGDLKALVGVVTNEFEYILCPGLTNSTVCW